jgi:hypothetical protein
LKARAARRLETVKLFLAFTIFISGAMLTACQSSENSGAVNATPTPEVKRDYFQDALGSVQAGGFDFILAFRKIDGEPFSSDDKKYLKDNAPRDTNRWNLTEDGKTAIAGSNYKFTPANLEALKKRFTIEDFSPPKEENSGGDEQNSNASDDVKNTNTGK